MELSNKLLDFSEIGTRDILDFTLELVLHVIELLQRVFNVFHQLRFYKQQFIFLFVNFFYKFLRFGSPIGMVFFEFFKNMFLAIVQSSENRNRLFLTLILTETDRFEEFIDIDQFASVLSDNGLLQLIHNFLDILLKFADFVLYAFDRLHTVQVRILC